MINSLVDKISRKYEEVITNRVPNLKIRLLLYRITWLKLLPRKQCNEESFMVAGLNYGAGIGHQIAYWNQGELISEKLFKIKYAHKPFWINGGHTEDFEYMPIISLGCFRVLKPTYAWDKFLGFGEEMYCIRDLKSMGYRVLKLPLFNCNDNQEVELISEIIDSFKGTKTIFQLATDQGGPYEIDSKHIKELFWNASAREQDKVSYSEENYNVAIHIRRGDVNAGMGFRFKSDDFFLNAIDSISNDLRPIIQKNLVFHIFSEGKETDFIGFLRKGNVILHLNEDSRSSFLHLVYADAILISPSGFSANAAAMGNARCYCPIEYRYYEKDIKWIYLNNNGEIVTDNTRK